MALPELEINLNDLRKQSLGFFHSSMAGAYNQEGIEVISEEQLDRFRVSGETVRVVRDEMEVNDVHGIVVAWDESSVVIRRPNRRVVKLSRIYSYAPASEARVKPFEDAT